MEVYKCCNCEKPTPTNATFCPYCLNQLRCKGCNAVLLKDAIGCIECGEKLISRMEIESNPLNQIEFEQKGDTKKFKAIFTNEVGQTLVETFGASVVGTGFISRKKVNPFLNQKNGNESLQKTLQNTMSVEDAEFESIDFGDQLAQIFKQQDDELILINPRLKQSGKLDNAIRLAILILYAYEKIGQKEIERTVLNKVLKLSKVNSPHFSTWIHKCDEIIKNGNKVHLSVPGRSIAEEILKEISNPDVIKGQVKFSKLSSSKKRRVKEDSATSSEDQKSSGKKGTARGSTMSIISELISEGFFDQKRKISELVEYCKDNKAISFKTSELSTPLARLIKNKSLKREKNSEGQYEYFK